MLLLVDFMYSHRRELEVETWMYQGISHVLLGGNRGSARSPNSGCLNSGDLDVALQAGVGLADNPQWATLCGPTGVPDPCSPSARG